jgi:hypothetical protein
LFPWLHCMPIRELGSCYQYAGCGDGFPFEEADSETSCNLQKNQPAFPNRLIDKLGLCHANKHQSRILNSKNMLIQPRHPLMHLFEVWKKTEN